MRRGGADHSREVGRREFVLAEGKGQKGGRRALELDGCWEAASKSGAGAGPARRTSIRWAANRRDVGAGGPCIKKRQKVLHSISLGNRGRPNGTRLQGAGPGAGPGDKRGEAGRQIGCRPAPLGGLWTVQNTCSTPLGGRWGIRGGAGRRGQTGTLDSTRLSMDGGSGHMPSQGWRFVGGVAVLLPPMQHRACLLPRRGGCR